MTGKKKNTKNPNTLDLLVGAIVLNKINAVKYLVSRCDVNEVDSHGNLPIMVCINYGRVECLKLLLQNNANPDIMDKKKGYPPLIYSLREKYIPNRYLIVKTLLKSNCNTQFVSNIGTPLFVAKKLRRPIYTSLLKQYDAV